MIHSILKFHYFSYSKLFRGIFQKVDTEMNTFILAAGAYF